MGHKSQVAGEWREHAAWRKICEEFNYHMKSNNILNYRNYRSSGIYCNH